MIVRSFQDFKLRGKQISTTFCYLTNKEASTELCSFVKHLASGRASKRITPLHLGVSLLNFFHYLTRRKPTQRYLQDYLVAFLHLLHEKSQQ